jgi:hypothetical protein
MSDKVNFNDNVFGFIAKQYNTKTLKKVQIKENKNIVSKILQDSLSNSYTIEKTGNKIIAMLRLNP